MPRKVKYLSFQYFSVKKQTSLFLTTNPYENHSNTRISFQNLWEFTDIDTSKPSLPPTNFVKFPSISTSTNYSKISSFSNHIKLHRAATPLVLLDKVSSVNLYASNEELFHTTLLFLVRINIREEFAIPAHLFWDLMLTTYHTTSK